MPAIAFRIYACPAATGQPVWVDRLPVWWNASELFQAYRQREIEIRGFIYDDYALLLTQSEAMVWDSEARQKFARDSRAEDEYVRANMEEFQTVLKQAKWVIVELYEWESGLD